MPLRTSAPVRSSFGSSPPRSIQPRTCPSAGEIRAIRSVCHTFAKISPRMNSNSLSAEIGWAPSMTWITEASQYAKTRLVVDEAGLRLPCELQNLLIENRDAFAKKRLRHVEI